MEKFKEVITDKGVIYYYIIDGGSFFDYIVFFRKVIKEVPAKLFGLIPPKKVEKYYVMSGDRKNNMDDFLQSQENLIGNISPNTYSNDDISSFYLDRGKSPEERIEQIKQKIELVLKMENSFNPNWDGIMVKDKAKLRDLLIDDLIQNGDNG